MYHLAVFLWAVPGRHWTATPRPYPRRRRAGRAGPSGGAITEPGAQHGTYAELIEEEAGILIVQPPSILVRMGPVKPGVMWKRKRALHGLRCAPKRWSQKRDKVIQDQPVVRLRQNEQPCSVVESRKGCGRWSVTVK